MAKLTKFFTKVYYYSALLVLAVLAFAGAFHLLAGTDFLVRLLISFIVVGAAVRELLV